MSWIEGASSDDPKQNGTGPGFTRFTSDEFDRLRRQHNILVLVGNGFDIQALHDYSQPVDSRYEPFFYYLTMRNFDSSNAIFCHMSEELRRHREDGGHSNWSDVEAAVSAVLKENPSRARDVFEDLQDIQAAFARFLQMVAPSSLLDRIGADARDLKWGHTSLSEFLSDFSDKQSFNLLKFPERIDHYHLFNFLFVNFNYTTLLDNYIYLDQKQFDPLRHSTVDTNFLFKNDPRGFWRPGRAPDLGYSGYVTSEVIHPHGVLSTPRSLLFGIDAEDDYKNSRTPIDHLKKPYWSQAHALYRNHFAQADLFIIFGCSLGESDGWWWRNIVRSLRATKRQTYSDAHQSSPVQVVEESAELIIYRRQDGGRHTVESVKEKFLEAAAVPLEADERKEVLDRIHVIIYDDQTPRTFLNTRKHATPSH